MRGSGAKRFRRARPALLGQIVRSGNVHQSPKHEFLDAPSIFHFGAVEIAFVVGGHVMQHVELAGSDARPPERIERLAASCDRTPRCARGCGSRRTGSAVAGSAEKATLAAVLPLPQPPPATRHQRSIQACADVFAFGGEYLHALAAAIGDVHQTVVRDFHAVHRGRIAAGRDPWDRIRWPGCASLPLQPRRARRFAGERRRRGGSSMGTLPNAPHMRLYAPVSASNTITRLLP